MASIMTYTQEAAYSDALTMVAVGEEREHVRDVLVDGYPSLSIDTINDILADALRDALKQSVQREDIDESWF